MAGIFSLGIGWLHSFGSMEKLRPYATFGRVYLHFGLFITNLALWFMALFGYYHDKVSWQSTVNERLFFTAVWTGVAAGLLAIGIKRNIGMFRSYGIVFLLLNGYTAYFQYLAAHSLGIWYFHLLVAGGSLVLIVKMVEQKGKHLFREEPIYNDESIDKKENI